MPLARTAGMRTNVTILTAVALTGAAGCTHTHNVHAVPPELIGHHAEVYTANGYTFRGSGVATPDGVGWRNAKGREVVGTHVTEVVDTHHVAGAFEGLGFGLAGGVGTAALIAASSQCKPNETWCSLGPALGGVAAIATGAVLGPLIGAFIGDRDIYKVSAGRATPQVSVVPTRTGATAAVAWRF